MSALLAEVPYWGQSLLRVLGGLVAVLLPAGTIVYVFLFKMMSFMQSRLGPMEAGPYGSMQLFAEVGKWLQKEDIVPERADLFGLSQLHQLRGRVGRSRERAYAYFFYQSFCMVRVIYIYTLLL